MKISEKYAHKVGLASLLSALIILSLGIAQGLFEPLESTGILVLVLSNTFLLLCFVCGFFLWIKGFSRFKRKLENPWLLALYLGGFIFGAFWLYFKYPNGIQDVS